MPKNLLEIVEGYREKGYSISDQEARTVYRLCEIKTELANVPDKEEYMLLLFEDEIRNYLFRRVVNATTMLRTMVKEA